MEKNLKHMTNEHSFYIPDPEYMTDLAGFLTYLGRFSIHYPSKNVQCAM